MAGTIVAASPLITRLEGQSLGYNGTTLSNFDNSNEPQIIGNLEIAGSIASFASLESITGWAALSNGTVYIKVVPDTTAGTCTAEFTATAPTWDNAKMGWYGTGANANHRYLFKLTKGGASLWSDKTFLEVQGKYQNVTVGNDLTVGGDVSATGDVSGATGTFSGAISGTTINTGNGAVECYAMNQNVRTTDSPTFANVNSYFIGRKVGTIRTFSSGSTYGSIFSNLSFLESGTSMATGYYGSLIVIAVQNAGSVIRVYFSGGSQIDATSGGASTISSNLVIYV